ncbi:MAG: riboflavin synthase [Saprospiraceae bacterium]|nr:riboflavin synthase [Saprospiraceae bacterium]
MFTGIVKELGLISNVEKSKGIWTLTVKSKLSRLLAVDESVSHNGVCLTIIYKDKYSHKVQLIPETLLKTNFSMIKKGDFVNLETSLTINSKISGHFVQGHVDCTTKILKIDRDKAKCDFYFYISSENKKYLIPQGSICINGVSLTISKILKNQFKVSLIPYTLIHTNFKLLKVSEKVNLEFDLIGKYILNQKSQ